MKRNYLILFAVCLSFSAYSQDRKLAEVSASKLAAFTIPSGISKIAITTLPENVQLQSKTASSLYSVFTRKNASGDYYKIGNNIIRVRGIDQAVSEDYLEKKSKERFLEASNYEKRDYQVVNGVKILTITIETDPRFGYMLVYIQNKSNANFLMLDVMYPMDDKDNNLDKIKTFIKSARFKQ